MGKRKVVSYELIGQDEVIGHPMYCLLDELVQTHHRDLLEARIGLAWCTSWRADVDGRITLGKCRKASDLDRELAAFDFVILLARWFWRADQVTPQQRRALLDHELTHAAVRHDLRGQPVLDERGRLVYRVRKHDVEEFASIVARYGCYKRDLEVFALALKQAGPPSYLPCESCREHPGWIAVLVDAVPRMQRCPCYLAWQEQRADLVAAS